jgi:ADP-ribose pyrophosphatase YjhB (NUDIX family)
METRLDDFVGTFAVVRRGGRMLFVANERRIDGVLQKTWDLPGGGVEAGELLHEALSRELLEEACISVCSTPELAFVQEGERVVDGKRTYAWRSFFFLVDAEGEPKASNEVLDVRWMSPAEVEAECRAPYHDSFREWLKVGGRYFSSAWRD